MGKCQFFVDFLFQTAISGKSKDEINIIVLTPHHNFFTTKAAVTANYDLSIRPDQTKTFDYSAHLFNCTGSSIITGPSQTGTQQMFTAKDVERQITICLVVSMKKAPFLVAVQRIVGGINVKNNMFRLIFM